MRKWFTCLRLGAFDDGDENSGEFIAFLTKRLQLGRRHDLSIDEQFQPVSTFLQPFHRCR